jgi:3-deoxy-D-manno-octulosonic-acid transferase
VGPAWLRVPQPRPLLVVVPRHPQRFDEVAALLTRRLPQVLRRSSWGDSAPASAATADAWLGDSLGEMPIYYAMADVALLGGSFEPLGGQNLIEAAACGCPMIVGPHTFNFAAAAQDAIEAGAARRVPDLDAAVAAALAQVADRAGRDAASTRSRAFADAHRGAADRMAQAVAAELAARPA